MCVSVRVQVRVCVWVSMNEKESVGENASFHVCGLKSTLTIRFDHSAVYSFIRAEKQEDLVTLQPNVQKVHFRLG